MPENAIIDRNDPDLRLAMVKFVSNFRQLLHEEVEELMFEYDEDAEEYPVEQQMLALLTEYLAAHKPLTQRSAANFFHVTVVAPDLFAVRDEEKR